MTSLVESAQSASTLAAVWICLSRAPVPLSRTARVLDPAAVTTTPGPGPDPHTGLLLSLRSATCTGVGQAARTLAGYLS